MKIAWTALRASRAIDVGTIVGRAARGAAVLPLCLAYLVLAACGGSSTPAPTLQSIQVTGAASAAAGTSAQLAATAIYSDNSHQDVTASASWSSSNTSIATVSGGKVSAVQVGGAQISASLNGVSANLSFTVSHATLTALQLTPATPSLAMGMTLQLTATGVFSDGSTQNLTSQVSWASANSAVASVSNAAGSLGMGTGLSVGSTAVTATSGSVSGSATVTVTAAVLEAIQVTPAAASLAAGVTQQLKATGVFSDHSTQDLTAQVSWASGNTAVAAVGTGASNPGLLKATSVGTATISAESGSISGSAALTVTAATLVSIQITPQAPSIAAGTTQQFTATGTYSDNSTQNLTSSVTWASSNTGVATISNAAGSNGLATSATTGSTNVTAASGAVTSPAVSLTVTPAVLVSIQITPPTPSIAAGTTHQLAATGTYSDNSTQNLTSSVTWMSSNTSVATISNAAGGNGLATSTTTGVTSITATSGAVTSPAVTLTVTPAVLVSIQLNPPTPIIAAGRTQQVTATGVYSDNSMQNLTASVTWSSSNTSVASISNAAGSVGLASSATTGTTSINATSGAVTSPAVTLTVTPAVLVSIEVTPPAPSIAAGTTQQFTATGIYSDTSTQNLTSSVTWSSSNTGVATISNAAGSSGLATSATVGTASITATSGGVTSPAATVTVTAAVLTALQVTPSNGSIADGNTQQFTAIGVYSDNSTQNLTASVTWSSSNTGVATISNAAGSVGLASSATTGTTSISAASGAVTSPAVTLTVTAAVLVSIQVTPPAPSIAAGTTQQFTATGTYSDNSTQNLTSSVTWMSGSSGVATISNAAGSNGLATSAAAGTTSVTATSGAVTSPAVTLTVTPAVLTALQVTPATPTVAAGYTQQFTATGVYSDNSTQNLTTSVTWSSSNTGVATVSNAAGSNGLATSATTGTANISATNGAVTSPAVTLNVTPAVLVSIQVTPANPTTFVGGTVQFAGTGTYSDGSTQDVTTQATWVSDTTGVATIDNTPGTQGLATTLAAGTANITAVVGLITSANSALTVQTVNESVFYSFGDSGGADGTYPSGGLIQASDGNFYGMTNSGGTYGNGAVITITPAGVESVLYSFGASAGDGAFPNGDLIQGSDGNFYGMTELGGANNTGAVIQVTPAGVETVLYSFGAAGGVDGNYPLGSLIQANDGNLYGMTYGGGSYGNGAVIKITLAGAESVLYSFGASDGDGANPYGSLIQASDGNLYGMTFGGGANGNGAVIKISLAGAESVFYSFGAWGGGDGAMPSGNLIQASDGNFYGMTYGGGANGSGAVIVLTPTGVETVLYSFGTSGGSDGNAPAGSLIQGSDGNFYGMTSAGGVNYTGAVIQVTPTGAETVLYSFGGLGDGNYPLYGSLMRASDGNFYGMTSGSGANNAGAVIKIN